MHGRHRSADVEGAPEARDAADAAVVRRSLDEPERFAELYGRHVVAIHRYVAGRLGRDAADDLAAETFLVAFRRRARFDPAAGSPRAWLFGIATNLVGDHRRQEGRRSRALARLDAAESADAAAAVAADDERVVSRLAAAATHGRLAAALAELAGGDRDVLLLVALGDLSYREVAAALGVPSGTVASRLHRARRAVAAALGGVNPAVHEQERVHG
jgi:RNA polymerase sigma-70 factor (ECF subfamily)